MKYVYLLGAAVCECMCWVLLGIAMIMGLFSRLFSFIWNHLFNPIEDLYRLGYKGVYYFIAKAEGYEDERRPE